MDVILLEKVRNLGDLGDRVSVKPGYGRNFLIPKGVAVMATAENIARFEARRAELEKALAEKLAQAQGRAEQLAGLEAVAIARQAGDDGKLFGSVTAADIAEAVSAAGVAIDRREVRLPEESIRQTGEYPVDVQLHSDVVQAVTIQVVAE